MASTNDIRNVAFIGHTGAGKTSLAEAILFKMGATSRLGSVPDGSSVLDSNEDEKESKHSIDSACCHVSFAGQHINIVDTPGAGDYCGQAISGMAAVETGVLVISAAAGIEVNSRKMMERATDYGLARLIVINKIDADNVNFEELLAAIRELFGPNCVPVNLPTKGGTAVINCVTNTAGDPDFGDVAACHEGLLEAIVAADDALMEKYLGGEATEQEVLAVASQACASGAVIPILFTNARKDVGITELLEVVAGFTPSPVQGKRRALVTDGETTPIEPSPEGSFIGQVFKVMTDPRSNIKYSFIRVHGGRLTGEGSIRSLVERKGMRTGQLHRFMGGDHKDADVAIAGDIVAVAKLDLHIGEVLFTEHGGIIEMPRLPNPMYALAIEPKSRGEEEKVGSSLKKFTDEDPCFRIERNAATGELVIYGVGDLHVRTILHRMQRFFKLEVNTKPPKIPYKETITGRANDIEYTHKKQTGGAGQYGKVVINVLPSERGEGYKFVDKIFGGAIDQPFRVSTDKGIRAQCVEGVLAGYPIVDVTVELTDGKTHPVDSKDIAFQVAGRGAFKEGFMKAKPVLLEPIVNVEVTVPAGNVGDVQGDLASRRGRPIGQDSLPGGFAIIKAVAPLAELSDFSSRLSSMSGGQGSYSMEFSHYEVVPPNTQAQIIAQAKKEKEAEQKH